MTVHFIGAGPGAPDLITIRGRDLIARSPVCLYAGSLVPKALLDHCPPDAEIVDTAPMTLDEIIARIETSTRATLAVHLSIHVIDDVVRRLLPFYGPECPAAVIYRASWPDEQIIRGTLSTIAAKTAEGRPERTALIIVGEALGRDDFCESALYSVDYRRRFRSGG
jgi:precorrin-4 methylase